MLQSFEAKNFRLSLEPARTRVLVWWTITEGVVAYETRLSYAWHLYCYMIPRSVQCTSAPCNARHLEYHSSFIPLEKYLWPKHSPPHGTPPVLSEGRFLTVPSHVTNALSSVQLFTSTLWSASPSTVPSLPLENSLTDYPSRNAFPSFCLLYTSDAADE